MPGVFVTATGTDVGKTYITTALIRAGRRAGLAMDALKPVLTGYSETGMAESDAGRLLQALGRPVTGAHVAQMAPHRFAAPLSPNMAAPMEGSDLEFSAVVTSCRAALGADRLTLIEGIGGVMVPLNDHDTVLDLIAALAIPVVLVTGTQLGALSHCLTACAAIGGRGQGPALVVINESAGATVPLDATYRTLAGFCGSIPIVVSPRDGGDESGDLLLQAIRALVTP